jgi:CheY-like chemotaxis protein
MKTRRPDTPVILLTAYGLVMEAAGPKPEQVDAVLSKPIVRNRLLEAMARVVRR